MKKVLFCLLVLSGFYNVYQYVNANRIFDGKEQEFDILKKRVEIVRDSVHSLETDLMEADYFSLRQNEVAQDYFSDGDYELGIQKINNELLALNHQEKGNPLVPYEPVDGNKFIINKIKVLNHRWIIADFYAGNVRGELLIQYFVSDDAPTEFNTIETVLYPTAHN